MHLLAVERMDKLAMIKSDSVLQFGDSRRTMETNRLNDIPQSRYQETTPNGSPDKYRKYGSRLGGVKVRHKRQVLQDMARPLKHWLYKHRDNPYPTKTEKVLLALGSHMTLVQVSNWFANARRRLKNTVRQPDLSWALRIKLYNQYIQGNAERLSVCSDDTDTDDECPSQTQLGPSDFGRSSSHQSMLQTQVHGSSDDSVSAPSKYKSSLLNRYLNDTLRHMMEAESVAGSSLKRRSHSESFSSNECERDVVSPASSYETEANFVYRMDTVDYTSTKFVSDQQSPGDPGWRELHAAVALTSLAQGQSSGTEKHRVPVCSSSREPFTVTRTSILDQTCVTACTSALRPALTSRIIQKSSHIAEVQTVKVALANSV